MKKTHKIAIAILSMLLIASLNSIVHADTIHSFGYSKFNTPTVTWVQLDENYTSWCIVITNMLTYNTTANTPLTISISTLNATVGTTSLQIEVSMNKNASSGLPTRLSINVYDHTATPWLIFEDSDNAYLTTPFCISLNDGWLSAGTVDNSTSFFSDLALGDLEAQFVGAAGVVKGAIAGYVTIEFGTSFASTNYASTVTDWLPLIIQFAMLGMILGLLKKFGKI
jgi:hypothetical protein